MKLQKSYWVYFPVIGFFLGIIKSDWWEKEFRDAIFNYYVMSVMFGYYQDCWIYLLIINPLWTYYHN